MSSDTTDEDIIGDPENRLLARQGRWRYHAEGVRDAALSSVVYSKRTGWCECAPVSTGGVLSAPQFSEAYLQQDNDQRQWRRGLYVHWQRMPLHPQLAAFDAPTREECTAVRMLQYSQGCISPFE